MFGRKKRGGPTVIGRGALFEGNLRVTDGLQVDGEVEGMVDVEGGLTVGPNGILRGDVRADTATVAGRVEGALVTEGHLHLRPSGRVEGEISYGTLQVERGAEVTGRTVHLEEDAGRAAVEEEAPEDEEMLDESYADAPAAGE